MEPKLLGNTTSSIFENFVVPLPPTKPVSSVCVDQSGTHAVLAGKQGLYVIDLEKPDKIKKTLPIPNNFSSRTSSHCIVQWNPHPSQKDLVISSNGKFIYFWDVARSGRNLLSKLECHSRAVQGLCWSSKDPNLFASCSLDTYINVWDVRVPRSGNQVPTVLKFKTFCSWTEGAADVKWNRFSGHRVASCHGGEVRVWDLRKETTPMTFITAHNAKITNIDWSYTREYELLTCANDKSIKFWNINTPRVTSATLQNANSFTLAKFLPVGDAILTVRREENTMNLWRISDLTAAVHNITGHNDVITSCDFRIHGLDSYGTHCQIASISRDNEFRLTHISPKILQSCGHATTHITSTPVSNRSELTKINQFSDIIPLDLAQEFLLLDSLNIPGFTILERDVKERYCVIKIEKNNRAIEIKIIFPTMYPNSAHPTLKINNCTLSVSQKSQYLQAINNISQNNVQQNLPCVESIILYTFEFLDLQHSNFSLAEEKHEMLPIPRLAGAVFTTEGKLIYFHNISFQDTNGGGDGLPENYQGLIKYLEYPIENEGGESSTIPGGLNPISSYYYREDSLIDPKVPSLIFPQLNQSHSFPSIRLPSFSRRILLVDVGNLMILNDYLADHYKVNGESIQKVCLENAKFASHVGRSDLHKLWTLMSLICDSKLYNTAYDFQNHENITKRPASTQYQRVKQTKRYNSLPLTDDSQSKSKLNAMFASDSTFFLPSPHWTTHPFAEELITSIFKHYESLHDIQTLAVLSCVLSLPPNPIVFFQRNFVYTSNQQTQSPQSHSHYLSKYKLAFFRKVYSNILFRWRKAEKAVEILKFNFDQAKQQHAGLEFAVICKKCGKQLVGNYCQACKRKGFHCALCNLPVLGLSTFCFHCGHGGHTNHMKEWFAKEDVCAMGCGCRCLQNHGFVGRR